MTVRGSVSTLPAGADGAASVSTGKTAFDDLDALLLGVETGATVDDADPASAGASGKDSAGAAERTSKAVPSSGQNCLPSGYKLPHAGQTLLTLAFTS